MTPEVADAQGGPLILSGGGSTMVAPDELFVAAERLRSLATSAGAWSDALGTLAWLGSTGSGALEAGAARAERIARTATDLAEALERSAEAYGEVDRRSTRFQEQLSGLFGWIGGFLGATALPGLAVIGAAAATNGLLAWYAVQGVRRLAGLPPDGPAAWLQEHPQVLGNPATVALTRALVSAVDDAGFAAAGVPPLVAQALGDSGAGVVGVDSSAFGALVLGGMFGVLRETPVRVRQVTERGDGVPTTARRGSDSGAAAGASVSPPDGVAALLDRIPPPSDERPQVRVERYGAADDPEWVVYIGGTVSWEASGSENAWDLTSNVHALAGADAGSYRAVIDAMDQAGVREGDRVFGVGHSQGALLAAQLAGDERYTASGFVGAGGPIAQVELPPGVPVLQLEHSDDIVPALGGYPDGEPSDDHLIVRREYLAGREAQGDGWVPAHDLAGYRETARLVDASAEGRLAAFRIELTRTLSGGQPGTATWWRGQRE